MGKRLGHREEIRWVTVGKAADPDKNQEDESEMENIRPLAPSSEAEADSSCAVSVGLLHSSDR